MGLSRSWKAASCTAIQELSSFLWNPKVHYHVHKSPPLVPILSQISQVHSTPSCLSKIHFNIVNLCYMPCQSHTPWLDHSNCTWRRVQVMKLLIMQFSPASCHLIPLRSSALSSNTLSLCSSLNVRDQVSHPCRTTSKMIVLCILIFMT
jgi:hypothetical protein